MLTNPDSESHQPDWKKAGNLNTNLNLLADAFEKVAKRPEWSREDSLTALSILFGHTLGVLPLDRDGLEHHVDLFCSKIRQSARMVWHETEAERK